ncbi:aldehyde dehydrogenase [Microbispora hainanensis]|uniref:Aldehyde dehydrogenase n=1 Tax=Microbispora hainanensis TaxID=568844 RepID=A0A544YKC4_9ACTN|nr:aldehyde dehydrogenase [Microbispora hainanensis]TQS17219.1 aldehyde dehydrogenase [Microbispora hainanensis]
MGERKIVNPANGELLAVVAEAGVQEIEAAVARAKEAYDSGCWSRLDASRRGRILCAVSDLMLRHRDELAVLESSNNGKPVRDTRKEVESAARTFAYYGGLADKLQGDVIPVDGEYLNITVRQPLGVAALLLPWNSPLLLMSWKLAPALMAGNTAVLKPSEFTPLSTLRFAELLKETEIPSGVVNVVTGSGDPVGAALVRHEKIAKVSFSGCVETGRAISREAGVGLKRVNLELGGKSANIVFPDANIKAAARSAVRAAFGGAGQSCAAGSRLLVHEAVYDEFMAEFMAITRGIVVGDPLSEETEMGPVSNEAQYAKTMAFIESAQQEGAKLLHGGGPPAEAGCGQGNFLEPTVFADVLPTMRIAQEEIFGPLVAVMKFSSEDEAVAMANGVGYGLTGAVWTSDLSRAMRISQRIDVGTLWINCYKALSPASPYGGFKSSGYGRENGILGIDEYTQWKSVWFNYGEPIGSGYACDPDASTAI